MTDVRDRGFDYSAISADIADLLRKQIFFVGGVAKSGTSWVQHLLNRHPQVSCGGESHFLDSLYPRLKRTVEEHNERVLDRAQNPFRYEIGEVPEIYGADELLYVVATAILALLRKTARGKAAQAIGERTPDNVDNFSLFAQMIPGARFVQVVRDPRDAAVSAWHHNERLNSGESKRRFGATLREFTRSFADGWVNHVSRGLGFAARDPNRYLDVSYDDLLTEPVPTLARLCRFLGVDDSAATLGVCVEAASFERVTGGRAPGQEDQASYFRKGVSGDWRHHLDAETQAYVLEKAGALMRHFGFA
jgi:Sulfotransferase family